jgi:hypothetical protein
MKRMARIVTPLSALLLALAAVPSLAQDGNVAFPVPELEEMLNHEPLSIVSAEISRPKAKGDITLKAEAKFGDHDPFRVKVRKAEPGADTFNNVPRYDLAAYELQKLFLDPAEYVVPPTALRMVPLEEMRKYSPDVRRTFPGADEVLVVVQYWLNDIKVLADIFDAAQFESDPVYARHIGQLNVLTYLIEHRDSNAGNFLISRAETGPRVFSIDHGVAFASDDSDRGTLWKDMRVKRLPADLVAKLRLITPEILDRKLSVLAEWRLRDGRYEAVTPGERISGSFGVRRKGDTLQMGLKGGEINRVQRLLSALLSRIDRGEISTY